MALADGRTLVADENYIQECILDPGAKRVKGFQPIMPTFQGLVSEQVNALVAYVKSLSSTKAPAGTSASTAAPETKPHTSQGGIRWLPRLLNPLNARIT